MWYVVKGGRIILFDNRDRRNLRRYWFYIDEIIAYANEKYPRAPDCQSIIKREIDLIVDNSNVELYANKGLYKAHSTR